MNMHVSTASEAVRNELSAEDIYYDQLHSEKYRDKNQTKEAHIQTIAANLSTPGNDAHYQSLLDSLKGDRFLPAGRVQAAAGATEREVSAFNCSVSQRIDDDMGSIMAALSNAAMILRLGTGIGYNFSHIRPKGALIKKLQTEASGPISFMKMFDVMASTIASSGHRRGAQMGILNVNHPDIEAFIDAKMEPETFKQFNLSVGLTDAFMAAVSSNSDWKLEHDGIHYKTISARALWAKIIKNAYDSAEPGVLFIDRLNDQNNLFYCEEIEATNPCAEQPLPPYGLCLLGSFNLAAYVTRNSDNNVTIDLGLLVRDIHSWVEAYDNIFDLSVYAIEEHQYEAQRKRRIGLGFTGISSALELLTNTGYGSDQFCGMFDLLARTLRDESYRASINLAKARSPFALFDKDQFPRSEFVKTLPLDIQQDIMVHGIRNSHLISYAPCGTISMCAKNVSSGVEPLFHYEQSRKVHMKDGQITMTIQDYNYREYGFKGKTLDMCSVDDHMRVGQIAQKYCDSAISKTVNVAKDCSYEDYEQIYQKAHALGLKGITVYRPNDKRGIVIAAAEKPKEEIKADVQTLVAFESIPTGCTNGACTL